MSWIIYSIIANIGAVSTEYLYRSKYFSSFWEGLPYIIPLALVVQFGLFHSMKSAPSWLIAWAVFFLVNAVLRTTVAHFVLGEPFNLFILAGILLMFMGAFLMKL